MAIKRQWDDAIHFLPADFQQFWSERLKHKRSILLITGLGWDPRMSVLPELLKELGGDGARNFHLIKYAPSASFVSPYQSLIDKNIASLHEQSTYWGEITNVKINTRKNGISYIGDNEISKYYIKFDLDAFDDVIIDISALPKSLYFTLLKILTRKSTDNGHRTNIHVIACQDVALDNMIIETADDTRRLKGFAGIDTRISQHDNPVIWAPVLANNNLLSLRKLHAKIEPVDVYPILPFPSRNPRNDDDLLVEYRGLFIDEWHLNPLNIIYAAEDEPLDVYQSLLNLFHQQDEALKTLGGFSMVVSVLSSKLSSIGAFMAAFEKNLSIAHAIGRHNLPASMTSDYWDTDHRNNFKNNLHSIWLTGEPYVN